MSEPQSRRLFLIFHGRFPSEKAAAVGLAKKAEAFADLGLKVVVLVPQYGEAADPFTFFGIKKNFDVVYLSATTFVRARIFQQTAYTLSALFFSFACLRYLKRQTEGQSTIISNEPLTLLLFSYFFPRCIFELHDIPVRGRFLLRSLLRRVYGVIAITHWLGDRAVEGFGVSRERVCIAPSGVDLKEFGHLPERTTARKELGLPIDQKILVYTGQLYAWKGVSTLAQAAKTLPDVLVMFVGGAPDHVERFLAKNQHIPNIRCAGQVVHNQVPLWQAAADILVLPNSAKEEISMRYTSPIKLFEYMASNRPIIAARLPSLLEVLDDTCAFFFEPDDTESLAAAIRQVFTDTDVAQRKAHVARQKVEAFTWEKRSVGIVEFFHL